MSGIAGIIRFDGAPAESGLIAKMTSAIAHRGPDGINHWVKGTVALGQCMLRTTPELLQEAQPLANEDETLVLVMDGWLSNWEELRAELLAKGARLRTRADAELVLRAYQAWGTDCPAHIEGDYAFVIWNASRREAYCVRDRMGNKPFYYHWSGRQLIFASELAPVLNNSSTPKSPNIGMIAEYVTTQWYSCDETLWTDVLRLVPAHEMVVTSNGPKVRRYWSPRLDRASLFKTDGEYIEQYRDLLCDCVRRASRSQNVVACDVSGGLDSSAIFCVAEGLRRSGRLPAPGMEGYTIDFSEDRDADEIAYARSVGQHLGLDIIELKPFMPPLDYFAQHARTWRDFPGFPNGVTGQPKYELMSSKQRRVLLTGVGGDEWLTGSPLYISDCLTSWQFGKLYELLVYDIQAIGLLAASGRFVRYGLLPSLPLSVRTGLRRTKRALAGIFTADRRRVSPENRAWLSAEFSDILMARQRQADCQLAATRCTPVHREQLRSLDFPEYQLAAEHADRYLAMFHIESRQPMRAHRFVQFAFSTPEWLRLRRGATKFIHREALKDIMPDEVVGRRSKAEFSAVCFKLLGDIRNEVLSSIVQTRQGWVRDVEITEIYKLCDRTPNHYWPMWVLWAIYGCHLAVG